MAKINQQYQKMIEQIKIDADDFADKQMNSVYKNQKDHLDETHKYLGLLYITYAVGGLLKVTPYQKSNILSDLNSKLKDMTKDMGDTEVNQVTDILKKNYTDTYYKNAYVIDSGINVNLKFNMLKKEHVDAAVNNPIEGEIFSSRIWQNKVAVADKVKQGIVDAMNGDTTIDKLGKNIRTTFNIGAYESQRLVRTENARVQSAAIDDIGKSSGCNKQMYCATLEGNTCAECAEYDGKYYDIDDDSKPDIPLHPNCRCLYINVPPIGWEPSVRKDNESKDIIDYENYNRWYDNNVKNDPEALVKEISIKNKYSDKKLYKKYKEVLGKNIPNTLEDFQKLKYNDIDKWSELKGNYRKINAYNKIIANEPKITKDLQDISKVTGTKMAGLEYRLKTKDSYLRKVATDSKNSIDEKIIDDTINGTNDVIRYTYQASADKLVDKYFEIEKCLADKEYKQIKLKNTWSIKNNPYKGINCNYISPTGQKFEIQYHTPESFELKNGEMHTLYEKWRIITDKTSSEAVELSKKMTKLSIKLRYPDDIDKVR